ncbi:hypothetical protein [Spongiactinospora sp. 9N601]|uniref:hypothetical protein n=1 Tax=Spongiactinospora sp. 9N601 TaxID=3375149 RepID=UPI00378E9C1E
MREPSWVAAWTGGRPAVHVGNVAEFNAEYGGVAAGPDHYSCLAVFAGPCPSAVVLPRQVDAAWIAGLSAVLGWGEVAVHAGLARDGRLSAAIAARPALLAALRSGEAPVLPWGRTAAFERVVPSPPGVREAVTTFESKRRAHALFRELAGDHPGVVVPGQRPAGSRRELRRELRRARRAGPPLVVKTEYGVGGSGTTIVRPGAGRAGPAARGEGLLLEEYVPGEGPYRDPTFDAVIDAEGAVHPVGAGAMAVDGTAYQGVTVGPGALPGPLAATAERFGVAVGRALAAHGYRGWYDVDFVTGETGLLAPTEINLRLTGPAVAFTIAARLDRLRGGRHLVRTLDRLPLGARLPPAALRAHVERLTEVCRELGAVPLVTCPTAAFDRLPYLGMALAALDHAALDAAEQAVRWANRALGAMFTEVGPVGRPAFWPRRRRPRSRPASA